jgi:hypothetical protein
MPLVSRKSDRAEYDRQVAEAEKRRRERAQADADERDRQARLKKIESEREDP